MTTLAAPMSTHTRRMGVASMLRDGADVEEIADVLAVSVSTVRADAIVSAACSGVPLAAIARRVGVSRAYASRIARANGVSIRARITARVAKRRARVARTTAQTVEQIARRVGVSVRTVTQDRRVLRAANPRNTRGK